MGKPCGASKMIQMFQAYLHMTSAGIWQSLGSSTCTTKEFEWLGIQRAVKNIKMFLETALLVDDPVPKVERRFTGTGKSRRCQLHMANCHTKTEKDSATISTEQCQSCGISIYR